LGAIVVICDQHKASGPTAGEAALLGEPLAYLDVLGRSTAERIIDRFVRAEVDVVSVLQQRDGNESDGPKPSFTAFENVEFQLVNEPYSAIRKRLQQYSRNGIEHSFLLLGSVYAETDLLDLFYFHREARQAATRAINRDGSLDLWVVDCLNAQNKDLKDLLSQEKATGNSYFIREYVNRLMYPRDLRSFASDLLQGRCAARPSGREVRRGVWIEDGAEVQRQARIVAPAYVGRGAKIMEDTLITRCSNVEKDCCVDYGSVIENSSILQNTEIGICLDVCHAVANGNKFLSLDRDVVIEISDSSVMRSNRLFRKPVNGRKWVKNVLTLGRRKQAQRTVVERQPAASAPKQCRLEPNPLQG
jgi:carbonic anhydrase/acetyltransferase-like protein (isoleucine patch superfamily)